MLRILNSVIFGFISGILVYRLFLKKDYPHGPDSNYIKQYIYQDSDNKYYKFDSQICPCPI